ncbi:MAG: iron-containing alcohol dehydrogenase [candidate division WOR-3 bacterium]
MTKKIRLMNDKRKSVKVPEFIIQGHNIIDRIYEILQEQHVRFKKILVLCDEKTFKIGGRRIVKLLKEKNVLISNKFIKKSDEETVRLVANLIKSQKFDLVIGFGGGRVLDVAKIAAGKNRIKFISIPTILSNDGIASPVSVILNKKGIPVSHLTNPPYGIIIDFNIIKKAPIRHLRSGVGDLISNLSAVFDCRLAKRKKREKIDNKILRLAEIGAKKLLKLKTKNIKSQKFLEALCDGLLKSGLAMCLVGSSRPASGSEHKISHAMDYLFPGRDALHGEQVGIATLFTMALQKNPYLKAAKRLLEKVKFPLSLAGLKIKSKDFPKIVLYAQKIRPGRYTILEDKKLTKKNLNVVCKFMKIFK